MFSKIVEKVGEFLGKKCFFLLKVENWPFIWHKFLQPLQKCRSLIPCACLVYHPASRWSVRGVGGPIRPIPANSAPSSILRVQSFQYGGAAPSFFKTHTIVQDWNLHKLRLPNLFDYLADLSLEIPSVEYVMMFLSLHAGPKLKCWSTHISIYTTRLYAVWRLLPPLDNCAHESSLTKIEYDRIWYYIIYGYIWSLALSARCMCTYIWRVFKSSGSLSLSWLSSNHCVDVCFPFVLEASRS